MNNWLDIILVGLILFGGIRGYKKGIIDQLSGLAAILFSIYVSLKFSDLIRVYISDKGLVPEEFIGITSIILTFLLVFISVKFTAGLVEKIIKSAGINFLNRVAGTLVGVFINFILLSVIIYFVYPIVLNLNVSIVQESQLLEAIYNFVNQLILKIL